MLSIANIQERIQRNKALVGRYTTVLYIIIFTGLGTILGSSLTSYLYSTPALITLIATFVVFVAAALVALAISSKKGKVTLDSILLSSRSKRKVSSSLNYGSNPIVAETNF